MTANYSPADMLSYCIQTLRYCIQTLRTPVYKQIAGVNHCRLKCLCINATFVRNKCNLFDFLVQQKLAPIISLAS